jgi:hypothetical protein
MFFLQAQYSCIQAVLREISALFATMKSDFAVKLEATIFFETLVDILDINMTSCFRKLHLNIYRMGTSIFIFL